MIASTPNVLVIHLKRLEYNVESDRIEKVNSYCSFPTNLDLKPYSFHEVMKQKGLLKTRNEEREEEAAAEAIADPKTRETKLAQLAEAKQPDEDDCYEYRLVGINVHSGTANLGHYWSYININR